MMGYSVYYSEDALKDLKKLTSIKPKLLSLGLKKILWGVKILANMEKHSDMTEEIDGAIVSARTE